MIVDVEVGKTEAGVVAACEVLDLVGHGDDEAEAIADLQDQLDAITWH